MRDAERETRRGCTFSSRDWRHSPMFIVRIDAASRSVSVAISAGPPFSAPSHSSTAYQRTSDGVPM
jgi:hypothetical protein